MRSGPTFPGGEWIDSPLRLFEGDRIQAQLEDGDWVTGALHVFAGGIEIVYDEPRPLGRCIESSRLLARRDAVKMRNLLRPATLWTDEVRVRREDQVWEAAHPSWRLRFSRWTKELVGRDPLAKEPLLRRYLGRRVVAEIRNGRRTLVAAGLLLAYDAEFLALADITLPAETSLPLCPGRTSGANLDILWNDDGLELFNRGAEPVEILGIRAAEGLRPWELVLRPGFRERTAFRRAPAGTAELVFECPAQGDAVLPRSVVRIRGGSEGSLSIPALPDFSASLEELPDLVGRESDDRTPVEIGSRGEE